MSPQLLAVIPARGGSKRIPRKNIKDFLGKPLIAYSIDTALQSGLFADVIVSTDDQEIADVAQKCGAKVPFMRSAELANDFAGTGAVGADAFKRMEAIGHKYDGLCILYATAPLLTVEHLRKAYNSFAQDKADYLFSCCEFPFPIQRGFYHDADGTPIPVMPQYQMARSQDLAKAYQDAGQFYFKSPRFIDFELQNPDIYNTPQIKDFTLRCYEMPRYRVIDIDTPEDWEYALVLANAIKTMQQA